VRLESVVESYYQIKQFVQASKLEVSQFHLSLLFNLSYRIIFVLKVEINGLYYLRKTKSLLDHFKPSLARDPLFVIVIFVHPSSKMARYGQDVKAAFLSP